MSGGLDDTITKHLELMRTTLPRVSRLAVLSNPENTFYERPRAHPQTAARTFEIAVVPVFTRSVEEMSSFAGMKAAGIQGAVVFDESLFFVRRRELAESALRGGIPAIAGNREDAEAGRSTATAGCSPTSSDAPPIASTRSSAAAKRGDLPVEQPARYSFVINAKTARALGLTLPAEFLLRTVR